MGGHGHGHGHHEPYVVPKPEVYNNVKIESIKELKSLQEQLAKHGLKDPWIRNEVWRYDEKIWGSKSFRLTRFICRGLPLGLLLAGLTIAYEEKTGVYNHHHGDHHDDHGHH